MFKNRPVIGLMPLYDDKKDSYWMLPGYMTMLQSQGAVPMMLPLTTDRTELDYFLETCDGFILTGGHDVSPAIYGQEATALCGLTIPKRDEMDCYILKEAVARDKAVLGICRGHQLMNAAFGGTLYQDLQTQNPTDVNHRMQPPYDGCAHSVTVSGPLAQLLGTTACPVNSYHHQAVCDLSPEFVAMATAPDGIVEAMYMPGKRFVWSVQWHPEFAYQVSEPNRRIIGAFLRAAGGLELKHFSDADWPRAAEILTSAEVAKTYMLPDFETVEAAKPLFQRLKTLSEDDKRFVRGIYDESGLVGFLNDVEISNGTVELGYAVHPDFWGRGYATRALKMAVQDLFVRGFGEVKAGAFEENPASIRVMEKAGMKRQEMTDQIEYRGAVHNCVYYSIRRETV
ncbi:MAG: GNAT family N-acetyltransferase [Oscillospiraceae bacterium]|nr:GNAT family N-acetyltransferase [Oscillospiraceae bacterium]